MKKLFYTLYMLSGFAAYAQPGVTKLDAASGPTSSYPLHITPFSDKVMFYANSGKGWELFQVQPPLSPSMVLDINPLTASSIDLYFNNPLAVLGTKLYFTANNGASGYELFSYNGAALPAIAVDIELGGDGSSPDNYTVLGSKLYFRARTTGYGYELWEYNPAGNMATRLTDINPGNDSSITGNIVAFANRIIFTADSGSGNVELWEYDPLTANTSMLMDINPGVAPSNPQNLTVMNGNLYFTADDGTYGRELWMYNGITTQRLTDHAPGSLSGFPSYKMPIMAFMNGKIYFNGRDTNSRYHIYTYDPATTNITQVVKTNDTNTSDPTWLTPYGGKLYFNAYNDTTGFELWMLDGNVATQVFDLCNTASGSQPSMLTPVGDDLYFRANECNGTGDEIFRYNYKTASVSNVKFDGEVMVFPNPASNIATLQLTLNSAERLSVQVMDITGRVAYNVAISQYTQGTHKIALPVQDFAKGNYIYTICNEAGLRYATGKLTVN